MKTENKRKDYLTELMDGIMDGKVPEEWLKDIKSWEEDDSVTGDGLDMLVAHLCLEDGMRDTRSYLEVIGMPQDEIDKTIGDNFDLFF